MKKIISYAAAFALAFAQPYTVTCKELMEVTEVTERPYEILIGSPSGDFSAANGLFTVTYNAEKLKLEEVVLGDALKSTLNVVNTDTPGKITIGFAASKPVIFSHNVASIKFTCDTGDLNNTRLAGLSVDELVTEDENGNSIDLSPKLLSASYRVYIPAASLSDGQFSVGETFSSYLQFDNTLPFTNGSFTLEYDTDVLEFRSAEACGILQDALCEINEPEPGNLKVAFISSSPVTNYGPGVKFDFTVKKSGHHYIRLTSDEFSEVSENGEIKIIPIQVTSAVIKTEDEAVAAEVALKNGAEKNSAVISISENSSVTNGIFTVKYDPAFMKFESAETGEAFGGLMTEIHEAEPGIIRIAFISGSEVTAGGEFAKLMFSEVKPGECKAGISIDEFSRLGSDGTAKNISVTGSSDCIIGSSAPAEVPAEQPTAAPTVQPTVVPTEQPSVVPTEQPSVVPTEQPSVVPTEQPSVAPTVQPTVIPTEQPSVTPTVQPTVVPTEQPSVAPTVQPTVVPTEQPSVAPTEQPSVVPTVQPSVAPTEQPSVAPTEQPSVTPTEQPSVAPTEQPSVTPTEQPSVTPTAKPNEPSEEVSAAGKADVNADKTVTVADYITLIRMITGADKVSAAGDINGDGKVDAADAVELIKILKK